MPTAHLFLYLVGLGTALSTQSSSSSIVFGKRNLPSAMAKKYVNHFKFTTLLEYKFGATRNYWIIKNKSSQIQWMSTEYNKSHIQGILKKNGKKYNTANFVLFLWRRHFKNSCFGFHQVSKREKTFETTRPQASWFQINPSPIPRDYPYMFDFRADQANKNGVSSG